MPNQKSMDKKEYRKTWYYWLTLGYAESPKNWITGTPYRLFGWTLFVVWKVARPNYPWQNT